MSQLIGDATSPKFKLPFTVQPRRSRSRPFRIALTTSSAAVTTAERWNLGALTGASIVCASRTRTDRRTNDAPPAKDELLTTIEFTRDRPRSLSRTWRNSVPSSLQKTRVLESAREIRNQWRADGAVESVTLAGCAFR